MSSIREADLYEPDSLSTDESRHDAQTPEEPSPHDFSPVPDVDPGVDDEAVEFSEASPELIAETDGVDVTSYRLPPRPPLLKHPFRFAVWLIRAGFGIMSLILLLAVIAAIPVVNFLALGYLLEVEARVARTGRLRDAFLLLDVAPRIGSIVAGVWLWILPLRLIGARRGDAYFVEPGGPTDRLMTVLAPVMATLIGTHICLALARGGSFGCFLRPIKNIRWLMNRWREADYMAHASAGLMDFVRRLRLKHHFLLGLKGFTGAFVWLVIPTALFAMPFFGAAERGPDDDPGFRVLVSVIGGIALVCVFCWLPFLQARFAVTGRWQAMFDLRSIRRLYAYAPLTWLAAIAVVYVLSLPLYLPKVFLLPQDAMWTITIIFIVTIYPARVLTGWAFHRAVSKTETAWFGWRWVSRSVMLPLLGLYVFLLFFTPHIGEHGPGVLFEHHALLLPVPF